MQVSFGVLSKPFMSLLLAGILVMPFFPVQAFAEDERLTSPSFSDDEEDMPFILLPTISSPELLKNLFEEDGANSTSSSSDETFDYQGNYDGSIVAKGGYSQLYEANRAAIVPNIVVALAKDAGTLLVADSKLVKMGNSSHIEDAAAYGTNAVITAVGQSSYALVTNSDLESEAVAAAALAAIDRAIMLAHNITIATNSLYSNALLSAYGATLLANDISASISGDSSSALNAGAGNGHISIANSNLSTTGKDSPLVSSDGRIEMDNIAGTAAAAQIAWVRDNGTLLIHGSKLESGMSERDNTDPEANAITIYRENPVNLETLQDNSVFQATDSAISSSLKTGSLFYLTNTRAKIFLSNTTLDFDENSVRLLTATGNNRNGWGTQGSNGATVTLTAQNQKLKGDIVVDPQSSVDFFILNGSTWRGGALNLSGSQNTIVSDKLNVAVDRNSAWVVTKKSTVTNLNLAVGARLIDPRGKSVKIVDSNGFTLVDGASDISVTVTGGFSTTVKTTTDNEFESYAIDRNSLDEAFGIDTAFGSNESSVYSADELRALELASVIRTWFHEL